MGALDPSIVIIQETKSKVPIKTKLPQYEIFERVRKGQKSHGGGGVLTAAKKELKPVLINEGEGEVETLSINIHLERRNIRVCNGYGPQEYDKKEKKNKFWEYLQKDLNEATDLGDSWMLQMDSNAWLGDKIIPGDPKPQNSNGKRLEQFLMKNPKLILLNSQPICKGLITRRRKRLNKEEISVLDVTIMTQELLIYLIEMKIDEENKFPLTNYKAATKNLKAKDTDHHSTIISMNIEAPKNKSKRKTFLKFKDEEALKNFKIETSKTEEFTDIIEGEGKLEEKVNKWLKLLISTCHKIFKCIRVKKSRNKKPRQHKMIQRRNKLRKQVERLKKKEMKKNPTGTAQKDRKLMHKLEKKADALEKEIAEDIALERKEEVDKFIKTLPSKDGEKINWQNVWTGLNSIGEGKKENVVTAKYDHEGKLQTEESKIIEAERKEIEDRLRDRPIKEEAKKIDDMDKEICRSILQETMKIKEEDWNMEELLNVLRKLKICKARDHTGLSNILFKPENIGKNLLESILLIMNHIKKTMQIPSVSKKVTVSMIPKKGSRMVLKNHRGIFNVAILRNILMKLLYNRHVKEIDSNMTDWNAGARKGMSAVNNIFIVTSAINDVIQSKKPRNMHMAIMDNMQMFDSLSLEKATVDLAKLGMFSEHLNILHEANKEVVMEVKGTYVTSVENKLESCVLQGDTWAPKLATASMEDVSKFWEDTAGQDIYLYKEEVPLGILGLVDDLIGLTSGAASTNHMNAVMNVKAAEKGLQYGVKKCATMQINSKKEKNNPELEFKVDNWETKYKNDALIEELKGVATIKEKKVQKYLGIMLSKDGSNKHTMEDKAIKSMVAKNKVIEKLNRLPLGRFFFEVAATLRESVILGGLLYATEAIAGLSKEDVDILTKADEDFIREVLQTERNTPKVLLYLETGLVPLYIKIKIRRIIFFQYILQQPEGSLIQKVLAAQRDNTSKGDWVALVKKDIEELELKISDADIKAMTKCQLKKVLKEKGSKTALKHLKQKAEKLVKAKDLEYNKLEMAKYLTAENCNPNIEDKINAFKIRSRMAHTAANFPKRFGSSNCRLGCQNMIENYTHIMNHCDALKIDEKLDDIEINNVFNSDVNKINDISQKISKVIKARTKIIDEKAEVTKDDDDDGMG